MSQKAISSDDSSSAAQASQSARTGLIVMILSVLFFTANTLSLKWLMSIRSIDPTVSLFFRAAVGTLVVVFVYRHKLAKLQVYSVFLDRGLISRGITGIIGTAGFYYTVAPLGAGKATLLCNTYVLFAAIIAALFLKELLKLRQIGWLLVSFVGIALLLGGGGSSTSILPASLGIYEVIGLLGAVAAASTVVLIRQLTKRFSNGTILMAQCLWIGIPMLPFALPHFGTLKILDIVVLVFAGSVAALGQLLMNEGYRRLPVAIGASIQNTWPLLATVGGIILFGETFSTGQWIGAVLILSGTFALSVSKIASPRMRKS